MQFSENEIKNDVFFHFVSGVVIHGYLAKKVEETKKADKMWFQASQCRLYHNDHWRDTSIQY